MTEAMTGPTAEVTTGGLPRGELFIGGRWRPSRGGATATTVDPSTEEPIQAVALATGADVDDAVAAARSAADGPLRAMPPARRGELLRHLARKVEDRAEDLARLETRDTGKPLGLSRGEIAGCVRYLDYYAGAADKIQGETLPLDIDHLAVSVREPVGVTVHITPWNAPLSLLCRSVAPALAAGNSVIVKPALLAPLTALALAELIEDSDWPAGTFSVVTGAGTEAGAALTTHPGIDALTFTGSVPTGRQVLRAAAEHIIPVVSELGGKSPQIVFADADLDLAAEEIITGFCTNSGQYCDAGSRLLVDSAVHPELLERLVERLGRLRLGPGAEDLDMGPLISAGQRESVLAMIEDGRRDGARVIAPAPLDQPRGFFVAPTILDAVTEQMAVTREEIFGPVLTVQTFRDDAEAAALADATAYGLAAGVYTRDLDRALAVARDLQAGYVTVNEYFAGGVETPFGGRKLSGTGRERGLAALESYTRSKSVVLRIGTR